MDTEPYLYLNGLKRLAKEMTGCEVVHLGIRPYGFHAGNAMALVVYPYLLCKFLEDFGKVPKLRGLNLVHWNRLRNPSTVSLGQVLN